MYNLMNYSPCGIDNQCNKGMYKRITFKMVAMCADDYALAKLVALRSSLLVLGNALEREPPSTYDNNVETLVIFIKSARALERQVRPCAPPPLHAALASPKAMYLSMHIYQA